MPPVEVFHFKDEQAKILATQMGLSVSFDIKNEKLVIDIPDDQLEKFNSELAQRKLNNSKPSALLAQIENSQFEK